MKHLKYIRLRDIPFVYRGIQLYKKGEYGLALDIFSKILKKNKKSSYLYFRCGMCFFKQGYWQEALEFFCKAKKLPHYNSMWDVQLDTAKNNLENNKVSIKTTKDFYETNPKSLVALRQYANELYSNKSYWITVYIIEDFLSNGGERDSEVLFLLSSCYEHLTDYEKAIPYLFELLQVCPENVDYLYSYAYNLNKLGNIDLSDEAYQKIIKISTDNNVKKFGCGWLHQKKERWLEAASAYQKWIDNVEDEYLAELFIKCAYVHGRLYNWDVAADFYKKSINTSFPFTEAHTFFKCAEAFEKADLLEDACIYYDEAILRSDNYESYWYYRYAYVLNQIGKHAEASEFFSHSRKNTLPYGIAPNVVLKNKNQEFLARYTQYYETLSIKENFVLLESFLGNSFSCNPYALLKYMLSDERFKDFRFVVVLNNRKDFPSDITDFRVICIKRQSDSYLRYLSIAKYLINNVSFPYYFIRKPEQIYLNTWHGTPIKTLGKDIKSPLFDYANVARNFLHCTHIISQNRFTNDILLDKYGVRDAYSGKIAETGYPRVDLTLNITADRKKEIYRILGINNDKPIVVYAPTWRGNSSQKQFDESKLIRDLRYLQSSKYNLIFKAHHFVEEQIKKQNLDVFLMPKNIDTNELLGCADILISDYSSIIFDFLNRNKPIISYIYDYEDYSQQRGLFFAKEQFIGEVCANIYQVRAAILKGIGQSTIYGEEQKKYALSDNGSACKKVIDFVFHNDETYQYIYKKKDVDLFFNGPFISNGITRSFGNLLLNLSIQEAKYSNKINVVINASDVKSDPKRINEFLKYELESVSYIARAGSMPMTLEEIWVRGQYENSYKFYSSRFKSTYLKMYEREARRLFGDTLFNNVINFEGYSLFWVSLLSQVKANNYIIFQHSDIHQEWKTKYPYFEGVCRLYSLYNRIISVSQMTMINNRKHLAGLFEISSEKFGYVNNTILPNEILELSTYNADINVNFSSHKGKKILTIGRLSHEKDHEKLIYAFNKTNFKENNAKLYIIGSGPLESHLQGLIESLKLTEYIYLLGQLQNPYPYLAQSDLFIFPSNHEGQPMVLLEALVLNKPIVATDIVGNRGVLKDKYGLLVENSVSGLVFGINEYFDNKINIKNKFDATAYNNEALDQFLMNL